MVFIFAQRPTHPPPPPPSRAGPKCEHCSRTRDASLCRFDDHDPHALSYADAVTVRCSLAPRSRVLGFAALAVSNNGGVDWTELASAEYAIVNFIVPPRTDAAFAPHAAPGVPAYFRGVHFAVEGDPAAPPFGCAFDRAPAGDRAGGGVSSALFRCETPPRGAARVEIVPVGRRRTDADAGTNAAARTDVALSTPSSRVAVAAVSSRGVGTSGIGVGSSGTFGTFGTSGMSGRALAASAEGGGSAFVVHLTVFRDETTAEGRAAKDPDADSDADGSSDARRRDAGDLAPATTDDAYAFGCLFGTTRVSASRVAADGGALECVAPARAPGVVSLAAGARHAETTGSEDDWSMRSRGGGGGGGEWPSRAHAVIVVVADAARRAFAPAGPTLATAKRRAWIDLAARPIETTTTTTTTTFPSACRTRGEDFDWDGGGLFDADADDHASASASASASRGAFSCVIGAHPRGGFYALAVIPAGLTPTWSRRDAFASSPDAQLDVSEEPTTYSAYPSVAAAANGFANRPIFVVGANLPREPGVWCWCASSSGSTDPSAEPARWVSSALVTCGPADAATLAARFAAEGDVARLEVARRLGGGEARGGGLIAGSSRSNAALELDARAPPRGGWVEPTTTRVEGGDVVVARWGGGRSGWGSFDACAFGTVSGIAARLVEETDEDGGGATRATATCAAPARAPGIAEVRVGRRSGASHERDALGTVTYRVAVANDGGVGVASSSSSYSPIGERGRHGDGRYSGANAGNALERAAAKVLPGTFRAEGGSVVAVAFERGYAASSGARCVFVGDATGGGGETTNVVATTMTMTMTMTRARVVSAAVWTCETPPSPAGRDSARGFAVAAVAGGGGGGTDASSVFSASSPSSSASSSSGVGEDASPVGWFPAASIVSVSPSSGRADGGEAVTVSGFGFARGARPGIWFGTIGPIAARRLGDGEEPALECVAPAGTPRGRGHARDRGPGRGDAVPVAASATGTEALRTSLVVGYAPEDIAARRAASFVVLPSKLTLVEDDAADGDASSASAATRSVSVATRWTTTTGGATVWISGSRFRSARGTFGCAVDGAVGNLIAASSAVATCVSPHGLAPAAAAPVVVFQFSKTASSTAASSSASPSSPSSSSSASPSPSSPSSSDVSSDGLPSNAPTVSVTRPAWATGVSPGAAPASGGATLVASLSRVVVAGESIRFGCVVGVVGPIHGRPVADDDVNDRRAASAVACVSPAGRPAGGRRPAIPVTIVPESAEATSPPTIRVVDVGPGDVPGALVAIPGTVPAATDDGGGSARARIAVTLAGPGLAYPAAATFADGGGDGARCVVGGGAGAGFRTRARFGSGSRFASGLSSALAAECRFVLGAIPRGFSVARVVWVGGSSANADAAYVGVGVGVEIRGATAPSATRAYPPEALADGVVVAHVTGSNLHEERVRCVVDGVAVDAAPFVSSATTRCELPPTRVARGATRRVAFDVALHLAGRADGDDGDDGERTTAATAAATAAETNADDARATVVRLGSAPDARGGVSPAVVSSVGGVVVRLAGANLRAGGGEGACSCWFGTLGPVAAACGPGWARCASPATAPTISTTTARDGPIRFRYLGGAAGSDAWWRDDASLDVALGVGGVASAIPSAVETSARAVAEGARVVLAGWGAANAVGRAPRASTSSTALASFGGGDDDGDDASCAFATSPRTPTARAVARVGGWIECAFASTPSPGFHVVSVTTRVGRDDALAGSPRGYGFVGFGAEIEIREGPELRVASPARTPSGGGGVLWITGSNLAAVEGRWSTACAVGGAAEATAAAASSALVACEIPPRDAGDGAATASVALVSRDGGGGGRGVERGDAVATARGSNPDETSNALWIEYLAPAVGGGAGMRPSRGPSWGGTPVRMRAGEGGWSLAAGDRGAGCRFGAVAVAARWSEAEEVECVTPSRGRTSGAVEAVVAADWRTHSFASPVVQKRAYFRYVRF